MDTKKLPQYSCYVSEIRSLHSFRTEDDDHIFFLQLFNQCCSDNGYVEFNSIDIQDRKKSIYKTNSFTQFRWSIWCNDVDLFKSPFEIRLRIILSIVCLTRMCILSLFFEYYL